MTDNNPAREQDERDAAQAQESPVAAGTDLDARKRAAKTALAAAASTGNADAAEKAQADLDAVNDELSDVDRGTYREPTTKEDAAKRRRDAASEGRGTRSAPQGRTAAPKDTTNAPATGGKSQK